MKRPLLLLLIGLVLGELCGYWLYLTGVVLSASLLCFALFCLRAIMKGKPFFAYYDHNKTFYCFIFAFLLMILLGNLSWYFEAEKTGKIESFANLNFRKTCDLEGKIIACKTTDKGNLNLTVLDPEIKVDKEVLRLRGKCLCICRASLLEGMEESLMPGDRISFLAEISFPQEAENPGAFPERTYDLANSIYLKGDISEILTVRHPLISLRRYAYRLKCRMEAGYMKYLNPEDSGMLSAMVLGDKSHLDYDQRKLYEENGVVHLLAVSGLHISIVGGTIYRRLRKKGCSYAVSCICGSLILLFYGCITGFGTSVLRACIMFLTYLVSEYIGRPYDLLSAMSFSGIMMLLEQPRRILESGFQISFAAVFAIGWVFPFVRNCLYPDHHMKKERRIRAISFMMGESLLGSLVIFTVTTPLVMNTYYECSPYSIFINPLILPAMSILMISALSCGFLGLLHTSGLGMIICLTGQPSFLFLWKALAFPSVLILHAYRELFSMVRSWKGSLIITGCPSLVKLILLYIYEAVILIWLYRYRRDNLKRRKVLWQVLCVLLAFWITVCIPTDGLLSKPVCRITMLDVGQGESILVRLPGRKTMLIDGGSESDKDIYESVIRPALSYYGISRLDYVLITHMDEDHISGIRRMLAAGFPVSGLWTGSTYYQSDTVPGRIATDAEEDGKSGQTEKDASEEEIRRLCMKNGTGFSTLERGDETIAGDIRFLCLHPRKDTLYPDRNGKSLTMLARWKNFSALFTGDLGSDQEENALEGIEQKITLLKVGHHGSKYSTGESLLDRLQPSYAIISAGRRNLYGHPHKELLERLKDHGTKVFQTKGHGAVCLDTDGESLRVYYWAKRR